MPVFTEFAVTRATDTTLTMALQNPTNISGWSIKFEVQHRFGGTSGLITKSCASGYNNVSGLNVTNGAQGVMQISIGATDMSGLPYGNYSYTIVRTTSGQVTPLAGGYILLNP